MTLTPPTTPPLGTPSSVHLYDKHSPEPNSQRRFNNQDGVHSSARSSNFIRLDQLEEGGLRPSHQALTTISFWFPRDRILSEHERLNDGPVNLLVWPQMGLLVNYAALGYFDGMLPLLVQALYSADSSDEKKIVDLRHVVILLRVVFALFSDTVFASSSKRRRLFLVTGWAITLLLCAVLACMSFLSASGSSSLAHLAPLLMLLSIGHVMAGASADGLMVEYVHREVDDERGCIQMLLLATRVVGELIGRSLISTGDVPTAQSGCQASFDCVLPLKSTFTIAACVAFLAMLSSAFMTHVPARSHLAMGYAIAVSKFPSKLRQTWNYHQNRVYVSFLIFAFLQTASFAWTSPTAKELAHDWLDLSSTSRLVSDGINRSSQMLAAFLPLWKNADWRATTFVCVMVATLGTQLPAAMLMLLDKSRSEALFFASHHIAAVCEGLLSTVRLLVGMEMAMPHMEATSFAATTTVFDLGTIAGSVASKGITSLRSTQAQPGLHPKEWIVGLCLALHILRFVVNVGGLRLLPRQKMELIGELQSARTSKKPWLSTAILTAFVIFLVAALAFNAYALATGSSGLLWANSLLFTCL